ncbi:UPF0193 protein EVG1 [Ambystoma mexicanum]|uniref:UPF0193 protein EVG1 n=1 Tax=Ambystoma mexicanum TaxID=8296 RepID=UPI0037E87AC0
MDKKGGVPLGTGFWKGAGPSQYSKETHELLKVMMQESKLTNFQQRQLQNHLQRGDTLPTSCHPTSSDERPSHHCPLPAPGKPLRVTLPSRPSLRPAESCRAGDAYSRDQYRPHATRDQEKEKRRLQNILATGKDIPEPRRGQPPARCVEEPAVTELDRFDELVAEIQERRQFLEEMESLGQGKKYRSIVETEISQKLREMEVIDQQRSRDQTKKLSPSVQQSTELQQ